MQAPQWRHEIWPDQCSRKRIFRQSNYLIRSKLGTQSKCCEPTQPRHTKRINDLLNARCTSYQFMLPNIRAKQTLNLLQKTLCRFLPRWQSKPQDKCIHVHILKFLDNKPMHFSKSQKSMRLHQQMQPHEPREVWMNSGLWPIWNVSSLLVQSKNISTWYFEKSYCMVNRLTLQSSKCLLYMWICTLSLFTKYTSHAGQRHAQPRGWMLWI